MDKLQMVHEYIVSEIRRVGVCSMDDEKVKEAWRIADSMQAEAGARKLKAEQEQSELFKRMAEK